MNTVKAGVPRQRALRKGRFSQPGLWYAITKCTADRRPLLVGNVTQPRPDHDAAQLVIAAIRWMHDNGRITCEGYVVMPDHFHLLVVLGPGKTLESCMHVLCGFTSRQIALRRGEDSSIWQAGYWDHAIRSEDELHRQWAYLEENPVRKGFVRSAEAWPYFAFRPWPRSL